ncbi:MAG: DivIVA domain-containing protein [Solirubrobacterales bacterium]
MDKDSIERIRTATFSVGRRGYDKREVDRFLVKLTDWLETGGTDDARGEVVRAELERIGELTGRILTDAHDAAEAIRADAEVGLTEEREAAERYASGLRGEADAYSERAHIEADDYAAEVRGEADSYAARVPNEAKAEAATIREDADAYAEAERAEVDEEVAAKLRAAETRARQMVDEANLRKGEIEKVIADLSDRRDAVIADMQRLSSQLVGTESDYEPGDEVAIPESDDTREFSALEAEEALEDEEYELEDSEYEDDEDDLEGPEAELEDSGPELEDSEYELEDSEAR